MSCADCEHCKADLARYLSNPRKYITSAAGDGPQSLEDLRTVIYNGHQTPDQHVKAALDMLFAHLAAGDQASFNPVGSIPPRLRPFETRALLSMAGLFTVYNKYASPEGLHAAPVKRLVEQWPRIRKWIQHFFYRALARTASASSAPITNDEMHFSRMGGNWTIFNMVLVILTFVRQDVEFFKTALAKDGTFTLIQKLWVNMVRGPSVSNEHYRSASLLISDVLQLADKSGNLSAVREQLLNEVGGDATVIAAFLVRPLRDAAKMTPSEFAGEASTLGPTMQVMYWLLEGVTGGVDARPIFGPAFSENAKTNPRPFMLKILTKYTALCKGVELPDILLEILRWSFKICSSLLMYQGAIDFVVKLLDNGLLEAYANLVPNLSTLTDMITRPVSILLKQNIATFLSHEIVITAAKNALHRFEKDRKADYLALKNTKSGIQDAWKYFVGHAFERAVFKGVYDAKFRKEDKLSCSFCHVRMNEKTLKKCSACKFTLYCSQECQKADWKDHKQHCKALARNLEVYKTKADTGHYFDHLVTADIRRHLPGLNALASRNPRTRSDDALIAYCADYTFAPPTFSVFPAKDLADDSKYVELGIGFNPESQGLRRELLQSMRAAKGTIRVVQVEMRGHAGTPVVTFYKVGRFDFGRCFSAMPRSFNPDRPRAIDEDEEALGVQSDWTDIVMVDAMYGRTLTHDEFHVYMAGNVGLRMEDQGKTLFERVEAAVKRRKDQKEEPCCRDQSGRSI